MESHFSCANSPLIASSPEIVKNSVKNRGKERKRGEKMR
jgi:hypothetical protein